MKKYTLLLAVCAAIFYSSAAESRICFLADTDCQSGKFEKITTEIRRCDKDPRNLVFETDRCHAIDYGATACNDSRGNWYKAKGCEDGYFDMTTDDEGKYKCDQLECGRCCALANLKCANKYKVCSSPTRASEDSDNDSCIEPGLDGMFQTEDDIYKFKKCDCPENFGYTTATCGGTGLRLVGNTSDGTACHGDNGDFYKGCECNTLKGYTRTSKMECPTECQPEGCHAWESVLLPGGGGDYCWTGYSCLPKEEKPFCELYPEKCEVKTCEIAKQSDFDTFWGGYDVNGNCHNITKDCTTLGYNTGKAATGIKCRDNTEPFRCLFDHEVVFCKAGLCEYPTENDCKTKNANSNCTKNQRDICFMPTSCKSGKHKPCNGGTLTGADDYGCGTCTCPENMIIVDGNCVSAYETCADANLSDVSNSCKGTTTILLKDGTNKECCNAGFCSGTAKTSCSGYFEKGCTSYNNTDYGTCNDVYENCEAAGYKDTCPTGYICRSKNIYTSTSGTMTTCQMPGLCQLGYAKDASSCTQKPDGTTCDNGYRLGITLIGEEGGCVECQCKREFEPSDPTPTYDCDAKYSTLNTQAQSAAKSYRTCCDTGNITYCNRRSKGNCTTWPGAYSDGCIPLARVEATDQVVGVGGDTSETQCKAALQAIKDDVATHNANCPDKQITDNISTNQCNSYIQNGYLAYCTADGCTCGSNNGLGGGMDMTIR